MSRGTLDPARGPPASATGLSPSLAGFPKAIRLPSGLPYAVRTPPCTHGGLACFPFARRYLGNRCFFPFLRLLRCFSSPGPPPAAMYSLRDARAPPGRVSPFRNPWINGYVPLPKAYRSLSRLSSALSAKASAPRPCNLTSCIPLALACAGGGSCCLFSVTLDSHASPTLVRSGI